MKRVYKKPQVLKIDLDYTISLLMQSAPTNPTPRGGSSPAPQDSPFASPFGDKSFD